MFTLTAVAANWSWQKGLKILSALCYSIASILGHIASDSSSCKSLCCRVTVVMTSSTSFFPTCIVHTLPIDAPVLPNHCSLKISLFTGWALNLSPINSQKLLLQCQWFQQAKMCMPVMYCHCSWDSLCTSCWYYWLPCWGLLSAILMQFHEVERLLRYLHFKQKLDSHPLLGQLLVKKCTAIYRALKAESRKVYSNLRQPANQCTAQAQLLLPPPSGQLSHAGHSRRGRQEGRQGAWVPAQAARRHSQHLLRIDGGAGAPCAQARREGARVSVSCVCVRARKIADPAA